MISSDLTLLTSSLGTDGKLNSPQGQLGVSNLGFSGDLASQVTFNCPPWMSDHAGTDVPLTLNFVNSLDAAFTSST